MKSPQVAVLTKILPWYASAALLYISSCSVSPSIRSTHGMSANLFSGKFIAAQEGLAVVLFLLAVFVLVLGIWATVEFIDYIQEARH